MTTPDFLPAGRLRRLGSLAYDGLLLLAVLFVAGVAFQPLFALLGTPLWLTVLYQLFLLAVMYGYFGWCWTCAGQTLAMKTWKLQLVRARDGSRLGWADVAKRLGLALLFYGPLLPAWTWAHYNPAQRWAGWLATVVFLLPLAWMWLDRDRRLLHDRLIGTVVVAK